MSATVRIPTILRSYTGGRVRCRPTARRWPRCWTRWRPTIPASGPGSSTTTGALRRFVNVYVGDDDVRFIGGLEAEVADGAKISIIPAVAGG